MPTLRISAVLRLLVIFVLSTGMGLAAQTTEPPADVPAPAQKAFAEAWKYEQAGELAGALDSLHTAMKAAGGHCLSCLEVLARVQLKMNDFKASTSTAAELVKQEPQVTGRAHAEYLEGEILYDQYFAQLEGTSGLDRNPKKAAVFLKDAESVLSSAVRDDPSSEQIRLLHGFVLAALRRDEDAGREFTACAAAPGASAAECARARRFAENVNIARNRPSPDFHLTTIDGKPVTLESLSGKVVLIDFWATWCKWCEQDSGYVQSMLDTFDSSKFALLEISVDEDESAWRHYVKSNRMEGIQARDARGEMTDSFNVGGYPTYVVLDPDGMQRYRVAGARGDLREEVRKIIAESSAKPSNPERKPLSGAGQE